MEYFKIKVSRFNPEIDQAPKFEEFSVPRFEQGTVLEALIYIYDHLDSTLLFSYGCRYKACGKCAMRVNGQPAMACETPLEGGMVLEPLNHLPVLRDLAVDRSALLEPLRKHKIFPLSRQEERPAIQPPEFFQTNRCNECLVCVSGCPSINQMNYDGPLFGVKLAELYYDARNEGDLSEALESYVDECILCRRCTINCPWGVNFSEIATKIKGRPHPGERISFRDRLLSHPETVGRFVSLCPSVVNRLTGTRSARKWIDRVIGIDERIPLPKYQGKKIESQGGEGGIGRRAFYLLGCFNKFNDPAPARDTISVLEKIGLPVEILDVGCCGMPLIGAGDLKAAGRKALAVSKRLEELAAKGFDIVLSCPSCETMIKEAYPALFHLLKDGETKNRVYNIGAYLKLLRETNPALFVFHRVERTLGYQVPCHSKGVPFLDLLSEVPGLKMGRLFDKCCGMAGTLGYKKERHDLCEKIGKELIDEIEASGLTTIASECASCQIRIQSRAKMHAVHPVSILRESIGC